MRYQVKMPNALYVMAVILCVGAIFQGGCSQPPPSNSTEKLDITVSILPQKYFVERIGGENVNVNVMRVKIIY